MMAEVDSRARCEPRVIVVVVAYNREDLVRETLTALNQQIRRPDGVVVVDNASTDRSAQVVAEVLPEADLIRLDRNTGGAGGFAVGIERAVSSRADLIWLMDDDTVPDPGALAALLEVRAHSPSRTSLYASAVRWVDGRPHPMNMPRVRPFASRRSIDRAERFNCYPVRSASFVSVLIEADAVLIHGLPVADYFLWNDDFEYSARLLRTSFGYLCRSSTVEHRTATFGSTTADPGARFRFEVRNKGWLLLHSRALSPIEKLIYAGATLRRWMHTAFSSNDTATLSKGFRRGIRETFTSPPRPNVVALSGLGAVSESIAAFEARRHP